jgi:hypothetical protein
MTLETKKKKTYRMDPLFAFVVISVVLGFWGVCIIVALTSMDKTDHDIFYLIVGVMGTKFSTMVDYFVGSSRKDSYKTVKKNNEE